jgi:3-carboxy-cis,cis-muconate cycloisomerase
LTTFAALYVPAPLRAAVSDDAWLAAMLEAERAVATVTGADVSDDVFRPELYDIAALSDEGRADTNPVVPLARALRERAPNAHAPATSQDILDTAAMLVARNARTLILAELDGAAGACAGLAEAHRSTVMAGRTLLQQAQPITFGATAGCSSSWQPGGGLRLLPCRLSSEARSERSLPTWRHGSRPSWDSTPR